MPTDQQDLPVFGEGTYLKKCRGCRKEYRSDRRNERLGPPELCKCRERKAKHDKKKADERRKYRQDPEKHLALSKTRRLARQQLLALHGLVVKDRRVIIDDAVFTTIGCNSPGCVHNFMQYHALELAERQAKNVTNRGSRHVALKKLLRILEAHHRDHNPFNNTIENYPIGSNVEFLCRTHHEQADRAKAGKAQLVLWTEPHEPAESFVEFLVRVKTESSRKFWMTPSSELWVEWRAS